MVSDVYLSGVLLTRNLENYSECININYSKGNKTDQVTSENLALKLLYTTIIKNLKFQSYLKIYTSLSKK